MIRQVMGDGTQLDPYSLFEISSFKRIAFSVFLPLNYSCTNYFSRGIQIFIFGIFIEFRGP